MTQDRRNELLKVVKTALFGTDADTFRDATLLVYIDDVVAWMVSAGVPETVIDTEKVNGCVVRGVSDLWNYGQGDAQLSPYFHQRVTQLCREVAGDVPTE